MATEAPVSKSFWKSKTFWFNILSIGAGVTGYLPQDIAGIAVPVVNLLLRAVTTQSVSLK